MSKKILIPTLIVIVVALVALASYVIYKQNNIVANQKPSQNQTAQTQNQLATTPATPVLTAYKNPQFPNFSFDYPSDYKVDFKNNTISKSNPSSTSLIEISNSTSQKILKLEFSYEFGGAGFGCWTSKQDNPKHYIDDVSKRWYLATDQTSKDPLYVFIQKSDFFAKGTQQFNEAIAFNNDQASLNNEPKLNPSKIIGCESSHGVYFTKTTFSDPAAPNQDPNRLAGFFIESSTKPTITKELSNILDSIKGIQVQNQPAATLNKIPETNTTSVPTGQTATKLTSNDLIDAKCGKYNVKIGDKIVCDLNFSIPISVSDISKVKFALATPAGSPVDLGSTLSVCNPPLSTNLKSISCTFDTKSVKAGDYTTSIDIDNDIQLGVTDNITISK